MFVLSLTRSKRERVWHCDWLFHWIRPITVRSLFSISLNLKQISTTALDIFLDAFHKHLYTDLTYCITHFDFLTALNSVSNPIVYEITDNVLKQIY